MTTDGRHAQRTAAWACAAMLIHATAMGQTQPTAKTQVPCRFGGDLRLREELMEAVPPSARNDDYFRLRSRLWAEYDPCQMLTLRVRATHELRHWLRPDQTGVAGAANYAWPDELVFDNLYIELHGLLDGALSLRVGRQDFAKDGTDKPLYGTGRVVCDGTSEDGSRTIYFNAIRATWNVRANTSIDLFGVYMPPKDDLAVGSTDRDLTGYTSADDEVTQTGAGLYVKNRSVTRCPFEAYAVYRHDDAYTQAAKTNATGAWVQPGYAWQTLDTDAEVIQNPEFDLVTVGLLLAPEFGKRTKGSLELACQVGERGDTQMRGYMLDAMLCQSLPVWETAKPSVRAEFYALSGDDPATASDEGWDPVWARCTQHSDVLLRGFSRSHWTNLIMPMLYLAASPAKKLTATLGASYAMAVEDDGPGAGTERGWWYFARVGYDVAQDCFAPHDALNTRLTLEVLEPGDYYAGDDTAYFLQWQVAYKF